MHTVAGPARRPAAPSARPAAPPGRRRRARLFRHELGVLLGVAGPIIVSQVGGIAMTTTDTLMVGPLGAEPLAAAGLGNALFMAMLMVCTGVLMGVTPLVSQAHGAGDERECRRLLVQALWIAALLAVPVSLLALAGGSIAAALGQAPEVVRLADGFLDALAWGVPPMLLFMAFRQYLDGMGRTRPAMVMTFLGVGLNVAGNLALIYGVPGLVPPLGLTGSGWSTTMVRWAMLAAMAAWVLTRRDLRPFAGVRLAPASAQMRRILSLGAAIGVQWAAEVGVFSFAAVMMGWLGSVPQAAHQVTINIASATFMVALGTSLAGSIRVGHHVGARSRRGVHRAALATYALVLAFMSLTALTFLLLPAELLRLYTHDPRIVQVGTGLLLMAALFQVFDGAQVAGLCVLRGAADARVPMGITILGYWAAAAPVAYLLGFRAGMGPRGIWLGLVLGLAVVAVLLAVRVRRVLWMRPLPARA